jgi:hypothetical protein
MPGPFRKLGFGSPFSTGKRRASSWTPAELPGLLITMIPTLAYPLGLMWTDEPDGNVVDEIGDPVGAVRCTFTDEDWVKSGSASFDAILGYDNFNAYYLNGQSLDFDLVSSAAFANVGYAAVLYRRDGDTTFPSFNGLLAGVTGDVNLFRGDNGTTDWRSSGTAGDGIFGATITVDGVTTKTTLTSPYSQWHVADGYRSDGIYTLVDQLIIGNAPSSSGRYWQKEIAAIIVCSDDPGAANRALCRQYLTSLKPVVT